MNAVAITEQEKYTRMWTRPEYRQVAPGEQIASLFLTQAQPRADSEVIDFGAGTGRGALMLALLGRCRVHMLDFARNCLDPEVEEATQTQPDRLKFTQHDLTKPAPVTARYGFCTDVMEHIPPEQVTGVLTNILAAAQHVFFQIACEDDVCGALIGEPLHLSVHDYAWWLAKFQELDATVHWSADHGASCLFYVTAWWDGAKVLDEGALNESEAQILENVKVNCAAGWQQIVPHEANDMEVMLVGGGPSLAEHLPMIRQMRIDGVKLVTFNGTYNWCLEHGLTPSAQVMVDARAFNARFTKPVVDGCKYLISSQCHPSVLEGLPKDRTYLWHTCWNELDLILKENYGSWFPVPGGPTGMLRSMFLLGMLGFKRFHLIGCDSCLVNDAHHAYTQAENDGAPVVPVTVGDRIFHCHPWMIGQAQSFMETMRFLKDEIEVEVYGDGLLAYILRYGAELSDLELGG